jgi:hypothetical protein
MAGVDRGGHPGAARFGQDRGDKIRVGNGSRPEDDTGNLERQDLADAFQCAQSASQLYLYVRTDPLNDSVNDDRVFPVAKGAVEVHDVNPLRTLPDETFRHGDGVLIVNRFPGRIPLAQPDDAARANVDGGVKFQQGG